MLHEQARFPIVPYYYLTALDQPLQGDRRGPKIHAVVRMLRSGALVREARLMGYSGDSTAAASVFLLVTFNPGPGGLPARRMEEVEACFRKIAERTIDETFYGQFFLGEVKQAAWANLLHTLTKSVQGLELRVESWKKRLASGSLRPEDISVDDVAGALMWYHAVKEQKAVPMPRRLFDEFAEEPFQFRPQALQAMMRIVSWSDGVATARNEPSLRVVLQGRTDLTSRHPSFEIRQLPSSVTAKGIQRTDCTDDHEWPKPSRESLFVITVSVLRVMAAATILGRLRVPEDGHESPELLVETRASERGAIAIVFGLAGRRWEALEPEDRVVITRWVKDLSRDQALLFDDTPWRWRIRPCDGGDLILAPGGYKELLMVDTVDTMERNQ